MFGRDGERLVEVPASEQRLQLVLVAEQDVDVAVDEVEEGGAMPLDTERIGERQRDFGADPAGDTGRVAEGLLRVRRMKR